MRLPRLRPADLDDEQRALYREITEGPRAHRPQHFALTAEDGSLNGPFNAFLFAPGISRSLQALGAAVRYETNLSDRERELSILVVAAQWGSGFEREAHEAVGRAAGLTESELDSVRRGGIPDLTSPRELAVVRVVHAMTRGDVDDTAWTQAAAVLSRTTLVELSTLVGYYSTLALQLRVFRVDERKQ
ncbi:carboxymuconolactone decarboxylase family protein [Lacisediminihabitans sp. FW035]